jgi:hypothetical protein
MMPSHQTRDPLTLTTDRASIGFEFAPDGLLRGLRVQVG